MKERVQKAVERVLEMQDASGAFGIWGPSDGDLWLSSYVTDFLLRAKEANFTVDQRALKTALDRLQNFVAYAQDFEKGGEERAYALYVLARTAAHRWVICATTSTVASTASRRRWRSRIWVQPRASIGDKPRAEKAFAAPCASSTAPTPTPTATTTARRCATAPR